MATAIIEFEGMEFEIEYDYSAAVRSCDPFQPDDDEEFQVTKFMLEEEVSNAAHEFIINYVKENMDEFSDEAYSQLKETDDI